MTSFKPLAYAYEDMMTHLLPRDPDLEITEETHQTWQVRNWNELEKKVYWPYFKCGGTTWRVLFYPSGNNVDFVSLYLESSPQKGQTPEYWYACAQFAVVLWNPRQPGKYVSHVAKHRFNSGANDWGFTRFCDLKKLFQRTWDDPDSPLLDNGEANITAYVRVIKDPTGVLWHDFQNYDSKKVTGMVGLKNQGATSYLNIVLQSLFFIPAFRKAVYSIPTEKDATTDVVWALQRLFYSLQTSSTAVSTQELTKSFGWSIMQSFEPQDVVEMFELLINLLEKKVKGTPAEILLPNIIMGRKKTYIDYENSRTDQFSYLSLDVHNLRSLDESFQEYVKVETKIGISQYFAGAQNQIQDTKKGCVVEAFPPVLYLQLKRFKYDLSSNALVKIDDYFEFTEEIDLSPYLAADVDRFEPWTYLLYGVVTHSGDITAGYYNAFLRPTKDGPFYNFNDDRVSRATLKEVIQDNFGNVEGQPAKKQSAYVLIYIRKSKLDTLFTNITKDDLPGSVGMSNQSLHMTDAGNNEAQQKTD